VLLALFQPIIVKLVEEPARETTVVDVLLGSIGVVGVVVIAAAVAGLLLGGLLVWNQKRHGKALEHSVQTLLQ
jgi:hypothetical protein